jgi:hypothetical protein
VEGEAERGSGRGREAGTSRPKGLGLKLVMLKLKNGISRISENGISRSNTGNTKMIGI